METTSLTRKQLYDLIWLKPIAALAKEYGITDNSLRTICKKFNIPLPMLDIGQGMGNQPEK